MDQEALAIIVYSCNKASKLCDLDFDNLWSFKVKSKVFCYHYFLYLPFVKKNLVFLALSCTYLHQQT